MVVGTQNPALSLLRPQEAWCGGSREETPWRRPLPWDLLGLWFHLPALGVVLEGPADPAGVPRDTGPHGCVGRMRDPAL